MNQEQNPPLLGASPTAEIVEPPPSATSPPTESFLLASTDAAAAASVQVPAAEPMPRREWWALPEEELLAAVAWDRYRASGPGGQKRNKIESAVRLRHLPTGLITTAEESRSQHENRARAIRRLREALALNIRQPVDGTQPLPAYFLQACQAGRLKVREKEEHFLSICALILDLLDQYQGQVSTVAESLDISTGNLIRFLETTPNLWQAANQLRAKHQQKPLRASS